MDPQIILDKLGRLARLDFTVFDEVKADPQQTAPAGVIAIVSFLLFGFGGFLLLAFKDSADKGEVFTKSFLLGSIFAILLWGVWSFVSFALLTSVFKATGDIQMLIRTMGYATIGIIPGLFLFIPKIGFAFSLVALGALFLLTQKAIQATTSAPEDKVTIANGVGFFVWAVVLSLLAAGGDNIFAPNIFVGWSFLDALR